MNEKGLRETLGHLSVTEKYLMEIKQRAQHKLAEAENESVAVTNVLSFISAYRDTLREQLAALAKDSMK